MSNRPLITFILLLAIQSTAGAEVYRCELADGSVIYGDKPVNLSDACQPMAEDSATEYLSVQQGTPRKSYRNKLLQQTWRLNARPRPGLHLNHG